MRQKQFSPKKRLSSANEYWYLGSPAAFLHIYVVILVQIEMNPMIFVTLLCMGGLVSASGYGHGSALALGGHYGGIAKFEPAPLAHDGRVVDTPEVAHLKAAHLAAHAAAAHAAPAYPSYPSHGGYAAAPAYNSWAPAAPAAHGGYAPAAYAPAAYAPAAYAPAGHYGKWTGPPAHVELTHDGKFLKDTPEVAHAKAAHAAAYAQAAHAAASSPDYSSHGGPAYGPAHGGPAYGPAYGHGW